MHYNTVIIGIVIVVVALIASRILCVYVRKPMVEFCNSRDFSASPWITLLMVCYGAQKLLDHFKRIELDAKLLVRFEIGRAPEGTTKEAEVEFTQT